MKVIHVDMDAFFASVEQRDRPELRGRPVAVSGRAEARGVVAAASYEARRFGVRSAMPSLRARRLCPDLIFVVPRFEVYQEVSRELRKLFQEVTDVVEPLSLDEAFLDVTVNHLDEPGALPLARRLKRRILDRTGLTASAGVGPNKLIAKLASDLEKPDGLVEVRPEEVSDFLSELPVRRLWGVGPVTARKLESRGLRHVQDLRNADPRVLQAMLGSFGPQLFELAHGRDRRPVTPDRVAKSIGVERTLVRDLKDRLQVEREVRRHAEEVAERLGASHRRGRTVTLKLRYANFDTVSRSRSLPLATASAPRIAAVASDLLGETEAGRRPVRLIGVTVSSLVEPGTPVQMDLFEPT